jgi:hypothetical protein
MENTKEIKKPDFILIPYIVMVEEGITPLDGLVYGLIYWFGKLRDETCTATNKTMARILNVVVNKPLIISIFYKS